MDFVQTGLTTPLHFSKSQNFLNFWNTLVHFNSPNILAKSVPKLLDLVPPFLPKTPKNLVYKSVPKLLVCFRPPSHLWTKSKLKLHFHQSRFLFKFVSVPRSASVKRDGVSRMQNFFRSSLSCTRA